MFDKLKERWHVDSTWRVLVIMLVFSISGMSILPCRRAIFHLLHIGSQTPFGLKFLAWLAIVFPLYQVFLIVYGTLLGEFQFFWEKEKSMVRWIHRRFVPAPATADITRES
jgi:hypothetical protein